MPCICFDVLIHSGGCGAVDKKMNQTRFFFLSHT